jgi:hypothetical protein
MALDRKRESRPDKPGHRDRARLMCLSPMRRAMTRARRTTPGGVSTAIQRLLRRETMLISIRTGLGLFLISMLVAVAAARQARGCRAIGCRAENVIGRAIHHLSGVVDR